MSATERQIARRFGVLLAALAGLTALAAVAFALIEHVSVAFGLIWTLDTVTTLGRIPEPRDSAGRMIVAVLELLGIGSLFYGFASIAEFFVSGNLGGVLELRRMRRMISTYSQHYIVCGYGRVGRQVALDLRRRGRLIVVIESSDAHRELADADGMTWLQGNASNDEMLIAAGIDRAAAVISCVDSDAENTFVTLSARQLRADITIVSRSSREDAEKKLLRAGANRVISPYRTTGVEMARIAVHPQINTISEWSGYRVEQIDVPARCAGAGASIAEIRGHSVIVALQRLDGRFEPQPSPEAIVEPGDRIIALGTPEALEALETTLQPIEAAPA
ncbi:MAG TPA: TrkA family potassium uptake protein [Solirubrobacteraceae bacterium]|nr:TrkA family potassium uptake protein [Solirubrobacteraceae bacterium]